MTSDGLMVVEYLFTMIWKFFTSWYIPGTKTTPAMFLMLLAFVPLVIRLLCRVFNIVSDSASSKSQSFDTSSDTPLLPGSTSHRRR